MVSTTKKSSIYPTSFQYAFLFSQKLMWDSFTDFCEKNILFELPIKNYYFYKKILLFNVIMCRANCLTDTYS